MQHTAHVGYKFTPDGQAMEFPGATVVSPIAPAEAIFGEISRIAEEAKQTPYAHKFTFLPPSSYHMTNIVLYNDHPDDRAGSGWSSKYPQNWNCAQLDAAIAKDLGQIAHRGDWPQSYRMRLWYIGDNSLKLQPATTQCANDLRHFRNAVAQATGIYWPDHDRYIFHITYAYRLIELTAAEATAQKALVRPQAERFRQKFAEFEIGAGVLCNFRDMTHFSPYPLTLT